MLMHANVMGCSASLLSSSGERCVQGWLVPGLDDVSAEAWQLMVPSACSKNGAAYHLRRDDFQS
jgi:hypothetical protein